MNAFRIMKKGTKGARREKSVQEKKVRDVQVERRRIGRQERSMTSRSSKKSSKDVNLPKKPRREKMRTNQKTEPESQGKEGTK